MEPDLKHWFVHTILALDLCPFAREPWEQGLIRLQPSSAAHHLEGQNAFLAELALLNEKPASELSTTLLGFPVWSIHFEDFLDFTFAMEDLLLDLELADEFQLVCFHPHFRLANLPAESFAHWPNSSPFPVLHILRRHEVNLAAGTTQGLEISRRNETKLSRLSREELHQIFPWKFSDVSK